MGRPKGSVNKPYDEALKPTGSSQKPVSATETPADVPSVQLVVEPPKKALPAISDHDQCLFHKTEPTRFFHNGDEIPAGWRDTPYMEDEK